MHAEWHTYINLIHVYHGLVYKYSYVCRSAYICSIDRYRYAYIIYHIFLSTYTNTHAQSTLHTNKHKDRNKGWEKGERKIIEREREGERKRLQKYIP